MKKLILTSAGLLFFLSAQCVSEEPLANEGLRGLYVRSIEQVLRLAPEETDIGTAALIVSEQWSDIVAGRRYQGRLDEMALEIRRRVEEKGIKAKYKIVGEINEYLFEELGFRSVERADEADDLFLHSVMDRKRGYCLSLSILYLAIGERLGLALYGVVVPGHFFVRYDDGGVRFNIEATSKGGTASDEHYIEKFKVPQDERNSIYMTNLDKLQSLGCFFNNLGNVYHDVGDIEMAMRALERAVEINPWLAESRLNLGNIYLEKGRADDAINEYRAAIGINSADAKVHSNLGNAYLRKGWLSDAVLEYSQAIRLEPNFVDAYRNIAMAYSRQGLFGQAKSALQEAIELEPGNASLYGELGEVYSQSGDCENAISLYRKALRMNGELAEAYCGLGRCYVRGDETDDGIKAYKKALAINPKQAEALVGLGNAYFGKKQFDKAIEYYERAAEIRGDDATIYYNIGAGYSNKGQYDKAVSAYNKSVGIDPMMGDAHQGLAYAYYNLKQFEPALEHIEKARALGADVDEKLVEAIGRGL